MKILILGGKGMAGHVMVDYFQQNPDYKVYYTSRSAGDQKGIFLDVTKPTMLEEIISSVQPEVIINCIGILNDACDQNKKLAFQVNSVLPHQLAKLANQFQAKFIHISTDCVFSGRKGNYCEDDHPDGTSTYAESKQLGEIIDNHHLTIRTSIIGPELKEHGIGLFLWFMKQTGTIKGYQKVFWNGVTTLELAKATESLIQKRVTGLYHLAAPQKISKYELLLLIQHVFAKTDVMIEPDEMIQLDRTIRSTRTDVVYQVPDYETMLNELRQWMDKPC